MYLEIGCKTVIAYVYGCLVAVAERLLATELVKIAGRELLVTSDRAPRTTAADDNMDESKTDQTVVSQAVESGETDDDVLARCVFIENVPEEMCEFLEVVIENPNSGGGPVELFEPDQALGGVLVRFVDQQGESAGVITRRIGSVKRTVILWRLYCFYFECFFLF